MGCHILIIDDQINLSRFIAMELRAEGYRVSLKDGESAEGAIIRQLNPDLVVLNWDIRATPGLALYYQLRKVDEQLPIVVITASDKNYFYSTFKLGAETCLTKPFSMPTLLRTIDHCLAHQHQRLERVEL